MALMILRRFSSQRAACYPVPPPQSYAAARRFRASLPAFTLYAIGFRRACLLLINLEGRRRCYSTQALIRYRFCFSNYVGLQLTHSFIISYLATSSYFQHIAEEASTETT